MDKLAAHYWNGCAVGELRYQRCSACTVLQSYLCAFCLHCGAADLEWRTAEGN